MPEFGGLWPTLKRARKRARDGLHATQNDPTSANGTKENPSANKRFAEGFRQGLRSHMPEVTGSSPVSSTREIKDASSTRDVVGARRSILGATLLDGLTGPSAGCRRLLRQFIRGLTVPERSAVCERATWRKDNRFPSGRVGRLGP